MLGWLVARFLKGRLILGRLLGQQQTLHVVLRGLCAVWEHQRDLVLQEYLCEAARDEVSVCRLWVDGALSAVAVVSLRLRAKAACTLDARWEAVRHYCPDEVLRRPEEGVSR